MRETPYEEFYREFTDPDDPRDGPDMRLLDVLSPADRKRAEQVLLARIDHDRHAIHGLAHLRSEAAVQGLRGLLRPPPDTYQVHAAEALWQINQDPQALDLLIRTVCHRPQAGLQMERIWAAGALRFIPEPIALAALIDAVDDPVAGVAGNAMLALRERLRLGTEISAMSSGRLSVAEFQAIARTRLAAGEQS